MEPEYWHKLPKRSALCLKPLLTVMHNRIFWEDQFLFLLCLVLGFLFLCLLRDSSSHKCSTAKKLLLNWTWKAVSCHAIEEQGPALQTPKPNRGEAIPLQADTASSFSDSGTTHWVHFIAQSGVLALLICNEVSLLNSLLRYWVPSLKLRLQPCLSLRSWQESLSEDRASQRS